MAAFRVSVCSCFRNAWYRLFAGWKMAFGLLRVIRLDAAQTILIEDMLNLQLESSEKPDHIRSIISD